MATQKDVKNRIASIKNINKITRAMEMVAAARLRRSEQRIAALRPYAEGMRKLTRLAAEQAGGLPRVPVLDEHESGDRAETSFSVVGRKGVSALTFRKLDVRTSYVGFTDRPAFANAREIGEELVARYVEGDLDRVELVYNRYVSPLPQHVWRQTLLPLQQADVIGEGAEADSADSEPTEAERAQAKSQWEYEPEPEELLARL